MDRQKNLPSQHYFYIFNSWMAVLKTPPYSAQDVAALKYTGFAAQILQSGFWSLICVPQNAQKLKLMMLIFLNTQDKDES